MITVPKNDFIWEQPNISDVIGDVYASFNLDTSENQGRLRLGKRMILNTNSDDVPTMTSVPIAFINNSSSVFTFAGAGDVGFAFKNDATMVGTFEKDVSANAPATIDSSSSDAVFSNGSIYVSSKNSASSFVSLYKKTLAGAWSEIPTTESQSGIFTNMLCTYGGRTYMSSTYSHIISLDAADAISYSSTYTVSVGNNSNDPSSSITKLLAGDDRIFVLCLNLYGGQGHVYEWDGSSTATTYDHRLESAGALSGVMFEGSPFIFDTEGKLLEWNGGTFEEVARMNRRNNIPLVYSLNYSALNTRFVHPNGMAVVNGKIQIFVDNKNADATSSIEETIPSGIYEYDPKNPTKGLIHKHSVAANKSGDAITQYGQVRIARAGALRNMSIPSTASNANGTIFVGAGYYSDATTIKYGIFYDDRNDTLQKTGYLITTKQKTPIAATRTGLVGAAVTMWTNVYSFFKLLSSASDKIVVKYRVTDVAPIEATITWTSPTTFTTTTDISAYANYEVEVIQGIGSGNCSQILSVTGSGTYTVTTEDSFYNAAGSSKARFQYWVKREAITTLLLNHVKTSIGIASLWIQFKFFFMWTGRGEVEKFIIADGINQQAE